MREARTRKTWNEFWISVFFLFSFWMLITLPQNIISTLGLINLIQHLSLGLIFAVIITYFYPKSIFKSDEIDKYMNLKVLFRLLIYFSQLLIDIFLSGIDVARRVVRKNLVISPGFVEVRTPLCDDDDIALNANSITLTPGTITVDVKKVDNGSVFLVHCISQEAVKGIMETGGFVERILRIHGKVKND